MKIGLFYSFRPVSSLLNCEFWMGRWAFSGPYRDRKKSEYLSSSSIIHNTPMKLLFASVLVVISMATTLSMSNAQDERGAPLTINGVGGHGCGMYLEFRHDGNDAMKTLYQQWAAGFMAGYSSAIAKPGTQTNLALDLDTYTAWLDKWCADNPLSNIVSGMGALRVKLLVKK